jgi:pyridoxamine 5'-phosphate oxidase family protein
MSFSEEEKAYLLSQSLARVATVSRDGHPDMVPVGFEFNGSDLYVGELDLLSTRKYGNVVAGNEVVALVVADLVTMTPWTPRFVRVYGKDACKRHDDAWWLGAGQNTPMRPGGAVAASA